MEKSCPIKEGPPPAETSLASVYMGPFAKAKNWQQRSHQLWLSRLDQVEPECLYGEKFARLEGWPHHWKSADSDRYWDPSIEKGRSARFRRVILLAELTFCFSCKRFAKFCRKMLEKFALEAGNSCSSGRRQSSPYKQGLCKAKLPVLATSLHESLYFHFSNEKEKTCHLNYTSVFAVFIELRCQYQFFCFMKWMLFTLFINGTLKSTTDGDCCCSPLDWFSCV